MTDRHRLLLAFFLSLFIALVFSWDYSSRDRGLIERSDLNIEEGKCELARPINIYFNQTEFVITVEVRGSEYDVDHKPEESQELLNLALVSDYVRVCNRDGKYMLEELPPSIIGI